MGKLRLLNWNFKNSAFCDHNWDTVKSTASNRKKPLYVTYLYPNILAIYIVLGTFSVELEPEKTNVYETRHQIA